METKLRELQEKLAVEEADKIQLQNKLHQSLDSEVMNELRYAIFLVFFEININFCIHQTLISNDRPLMTSPKIQLQNKLHQSLYSEVMNEIRYNFFPQYFSKFILISLFINLMNRKRFSFIEWLVHLFSV